MPVTRLRALAPHSRLLMGFQHPPATQLPPEYLSRGWNHATSHLNVSRKHLQPGSASSHFH